MSDWVRPVVRAMSGYVPGEQPRAGERVIKLNTNENPYPPSPKVMEAIRDVGADVLRKYPNPTADAFRDAAGSVLGFGRDWIIAGNGSDDILAIATRTFLSSKDVLAYPDPTYSLYPVLAEINESGRAAVAWEDGFDLPVEGLLAARPRAVFLANPNAPTGTFVAPARVAELARRLDGVVLVDEAYVDFADENCLELVREYPNVVVSRTLSKAYSLAGLRFGYAVARPRVIEQMMKVKDSYNCDAVATAAATAAILDQDWARDNWAKVRSERRRLTEELGRLGFRVLPSQANFVLARVPGGAAGELKDRLKAEGILVRYFDKPGLSDKLRITVGSPQENEALIRTLRNLLT